MDARLGPSGALLSLALLLIGIPPLSGQELQSPSLRSALFGSPSSLAIRPAPAADTLELAGRKSPALAVLLSAVLPGVGGQIYTEQYWHIPVYGGLFYWFGRNYLKGDDLYDKYRALYAESVETGVNLGSGDANYRRLRDFYANERERFAMYFLLTYLANLVDAYVSASLASFDVGEDLNGSSNIRLQVRLPLSIPSR